MTIQFPHKSFILFSCVLGFVSGITMQSYWQNHETSFYFLSTIIAIIVLFLFYRYQYAWMCALSVIGWCCGVWYMHNAQKHVEQSIAMHHNAQKKGVAIVSKETIQKQFHDYVHVRFLDEDFFTKITVPKYTQLQYGDEIYVTCTRTRQENFTDEFDYQKYLIMQGVYVVCEQKGMEYKIQNQRYAPMRMMIRLRLYLEGIVNRAMPAPQSALANGLLFGGSTRLSQSIQDAFAQTGMTHIVAVSGYNVSIIAIVVLASGLFVGLKRKSATVCAIGCICFFVVLIGLPSSGVRAAIMAILLLIAAIHGRLTTAYIAIVTTAAVMLIQNPFLLRYDIGFQLSFFATIGIVMIYPLCEKYFINNKQNAFGLYEIFFLTFSAQIFVLPIIAYNFHIISITSLIVNMCVLPIIPITMLCVFLLIIFSFFMPLIASFFAWCAYYLLTYEIMIILFFSQLSWNTIVITKVSPIICGVYYSVILCVYFFVQHRHKQ